MLASEVLKDDVAPVRPLARTARWCCIAVGLVFAALPAAPALGLSLPSLSARGIVVHAVLAGLALAAGVLPGWYSGRAAMMLLVGLGCGGLGMLGIGPAAAAEDVAYEWAVFALVTAVGLPAALLFRAHYRAFRAARVILALALLLSVPFIAHGLMRTLGAPSLSLQVANGVAVGSVVASLLGFMGAETTGAGVPLATLVTMAVSGVLATEALFDAGRMLPLAQALRPLASIGAFAGGAFLGALGLFGLLAWRFGPKARAADPRSRPAANKPPRPSIGGWLSRR